MGVGHKSVEDDKQQGHQHIGAQVYEEADNRTKHQIVWHGVRNRRHKDRDTRGYNDDDGKAEKHRHIIRERTKDTARFCHLPYFIEGIFHITYQHQYCIKHEQQTHPQENTTLSMDQVTIYETDDGVCSLGL